MLCGGGFGWQPVDYPTELPKAALPVGFFENGNYSYACRSTVPKDDGWLQFLSGVVSLTNYHIKTNTKNLSNNRYFFHYRLILILFHAT